ncbi:MAG: CPBP family intramembrane glutamic endopeptidase [Gemmatimonadota bacterium]
MGILRTQAGRVRAGWRIFLFFLLLPLFLVPVSLLPLESLNWQTLPLLVAGLLAGWVLLAMDGRGPGALGFYLAPEAAREAIMGLCLGVVVALAVTLGIFLLGGMRWESETGTSWGYLQAAIRALWFFTLPAAAEEVLFRGYLFQALAEVWGGIQALWATSLAFGVLHLTNPNANPVGIGNIVVAGLFLGAVYLKTASLWWATGAHLGWNWALGFLADTSVSGLDLVDAPFYEPVVRGTRWISGGAFGAEGSVVATAILAAAAYLVWRNPALKPGSKAMDVRPLILSGP